MEKQIMNVTKSQSQLELHTLPVAATVELQDAFLRTIGELADEAGIRLYVVGGYVRDLMREAPRKDLDFTVIGDALAFARLVAEHFQSKIVVYERFRTALVPIGEYHCEFVGTRKEEYLPSSRKPIVSEGTLEDDLRRRDFTVNAMAISINASTFGDLIDIFDGRMDMRRQILRTPLDPIVTFSDDPLRMMRAARFASQLMFTVEPEALEAMEQMAQRITIISQERITDEFLKILASPKPSIGLKILFETGLLKYVFPEVHNLAGIDLVQVGEQEYGHKDVFLHTLQVVDNVSHMTDNVWLRFATLMHDIAKPKTKRFVNGTGWTFHGHEEIGARWQDRIFRRMKLPLQHLPYVQRLVRLHQRPMVLVSEGVTDSAIRRLAAHAGDALEDLFMLCRADITSKNPRAVQRYLKNYDVVFNKVVEVQAKDQLRAFQSPVRGEEIMALCGLQPSRAVGIIKHAIEEAILDGIIPNEYEAARAYLLEHRDEWLREAEQVERAPRIREER
jgi:poly(A) polymerase